MAGNKGLREINIEWQRKTFKAKRLGLVPPRYQRNPAKFLAAAEEYAWKVLEAYKIPQCEIGDLIAAVGNVATDSETAEVNTCRRILENAHFARRQLAKLATGEPLTKERAEMLLFNVCRIVELLNAPFAKLGADAVQRSKNGGNAGTVSKRQSGLNGDLDHRDSRICKLSKQGLPTSTIAERENLTQRQVQKILKKKRSEL